MNDLCCVQFKSGGEGLRANTRNLLIRSMLEKLRQRIDDRGFDLLIANTLEPLMQVVPPPTTQRPGLVESVGRRVALFAAGNEPIDLLISSFQRPVRPHSYFEMCDQPA